MKTYLAPVSVSAPLAIHTRMLAPTDPVCAVTTPGDEKMPLPCCEKVHAPPAVRSSRTWLR